jgi:hypothetical protein
VAKVKGKSTAKPCRNNEDVNAGGHHRVVAAVTTDARTSTITDPRATLYAAETAAIVHRQRICNDTTVLGETLAHRATAAPRSGVSRRIDAFAAMPQARFSP